MLSYSQSSQNHQMELLQLSLVPLPRLPLEYAIIIITSKSAKDCVTPDLSQNHCLTSLPSYQSAIIELLNE